jgi:5'(3')-deoxyribonucleotidase
MIRKKIYVDQDMVLANFNKAYNEDRKKYPDQLYPQSQFGFFLKLEEIEDAIDAVKMLEAHFDVYILTRPSVYNINSYSEKALWIFNRFGIKTLENTILCCDKSLFKGAYLIDDSKGDGQPEFDGEWIQFGTDKFPNWKNVIDYILDKEFDIDNL